MGFNHGGGGGGQFLYTDATLVYMGRAFQLSHMGRKAIS